MRKILLLLSLVTFISSSVYSQNLDRERQKVTYTQLPLTPLPAEYTTYWQNIDLGYIYSADSKTEVTNTIKNAAVISHLEKTQRDGIQVLARLETYYKSESRFESEVKTSTKDDKEIKTTYYFVNFDYKYPLYFEIILPNEVDPIASGFSNNSSEMVSYTSRKFTSRSDLNKWWSDNYRTLQAKLRTDLLNANVKALNAYLDQQYSYRKYTFYPTYYQVKKFKKFEYSDLDQAIALTKEGLSSIQAEEIIFGDSFSSKMNDAIEIWNKALTESNLEERKVRINEKVTEAIYNNLFLAHAMLDEFEKANEIKTTAEEKLGKKAIDNFSERWLDGRIERFKENEGRIPSTLN